MEPTNQGEVPKLSQVIQIDEAKIQEHLGEVVRRTVEKTLNAHAGRRGRPSLPGQAVRTDRSPQGHASRIPPAAPTNESRAKSH